MHRAEAIWMSSDGHMMLYASFNDSLVEEMHISWFGEGNKALYPDIRSLRYPKVIIIFIIYLILYIINILKIFIIQILINFSKISMFSNILYMYDICIT